MISFLLSLLVFTPLLGALLIVLLPKKWASSYKLLALLAVLFQVGCASILYTGFEGGEGSPKGVFDGNAFQFAEKYNWIDMSVGNLGKLSIDYHIGVDGISISMVLLSVLVMLIALVASWRVQEKAKGYFSLFLLLNSAVIGCFVALDFFLFYLFFEFMLLPMYFLIGIWGGERREYASIKFFLYTLLGSVFILVVMIGLYSSAIDPAATAVSLGLATSEAAVDPMALRQVQDLLANGLLPASKMVHTFDILLLSDADNYIPGSLLSTIDAQYFGDMPFRWIAFLLLFIGFAIKIPAVPLHTWLPDAHVEAPTPISVILAGVLLKVGGYGLIRTAYTLFPDGALYFAWWVGLVGMVSILYGAFNALASKDLKRLVAYSSVSHMGFVLLGLASLTAEGVNGAIYQMFSHGLISSMLFLIVGVLYDRTHDRSIENYSGLAAKMPGYTVVVVIAFFASLGLPGFSGFIAEILVFLGAFKSSVANALLPKWMAIVATFGLLLGAAYYLWTIQRMFFGQYHLRKKEWESQLVDLSAREWSMFMPLILLIVLLGIFPHFLLEMISESVGYFVARVQDIGLQQLKSISIN